MKKERRVVAAIVTVVLSLALLIPYSCKDKHETPPQLVAQENTSEFFVNEDMAKTVAENFMRKTNPSLKSTKNYKLEKIKDEMGEELIYVINFDEGGFVLMPADNRVQPILAFSDKNHFNTENHKEVNGLSLWIDVMIKEIKLVRKSKVEQNEEMKELWKKHITIFNLKDEGDPPDDPCVQTTTTVGPLLTTIWRQGDGFNTYCPTEQDVEDDCGTCDCDFNTTYLGGHARAGCLAVAMGQIMYYHEYPNTYSWNLMPTGETGNSYAADLLSDIGVDLSMDYQCGGSYAPVSNAVSVFENDYNYSTSATFTNYGYSDFSDIKIEINADRPVLFSGISVEGAHAWVCDGWRESIICLNNLGYVYQYLSMNWGWGANEGNGFYHYNNLNGFTTTLQIVKGIKP